LLVVKYALAACLVAAGVYGFSKRHDIIDAFDWDPATEKTALPAFDPKLLAEANALPVPTSDITVETAPDTRAIAVPSVPTSTTAPVAVEGGRTTLDGVVLGPGGVPVAGATVRIERLVGTDEGVLDVTSNGSGAWSAGRLLGGRYRVRAWRAPTHAQTGSEVTFVEEGQRRSFRLELEAPSGVEFTPEVATDKIILGQTGSVSATVRAPFVTTDGRITVGGRPGDVITVTTNGVFAGQGGTKTTDPSGLVTFPLACNQLGNGQVTVAGVNQTKTFTVSCIPVPTTTTTAPTTTTTAPGATTSTTKAGA
jgi:hypothetical protein